MQNADRVREQVSQLTEANEVKLEVSESHRALIAERKIAAERELMRFRALNESLLVAEKFLAQQRALLQEVPNTAIHVLEGVDGSLEEIRRLQRQAQDMMLKHDGAFAALGMLEEMLQQQIAQTTSRIRGLEAQGAKAIVVDRVPTVTGEVSLMDQLSDADDANDPIGSPKQKPSKRRSESTKTEP